MKACALLLLISFHLALSQCIKPASVKVLPVFFVATDAPMPSDQQKADLIRHVKWSQSRYLELLGGRSTFGIADTIPLVYKSRQNTNYYVQNNAADNFASELMEYSGRNRYNCPFIFLVVFMDSISEFPTGGGRPFNGGYNTGGGVIQMSSYTLSKRPNFQSTLQHELGHSFGLPHVDVYGYDMDTNMSFMSYNPKHHNNYFSPSATPGIMIPEDIRGLALNDLAFPNLEFDGQREIPAGYTIAGTVPLGIQEIPNQPYVSASTTSGSQYNTDIKNTLYHIPTAKQDGNILRVDLCWLSEVLPNGWTEVLYHFPEYVFLDGVYLHSGFGADPYHHDADSMEIYLDSPGDSSRIAAKKAETVDSYLSFKEIRTNALRVRLRGRNGSTVCLRGMGFFHKGDDVFPAYVPYGSRDPDSKLYPGPVHSLLPANNAVIFNQPEIVLTWQKSPKAKRYLVQFDTSANLCNPTSVETIDTTCAIAILHPQKTCFWRVRGRNDFNYGAGEWSEVRAFTTGKITPAGKAPIKADIRSGSGILSVHRSAGRFVFAIEAPTPSKASLRVYDLQGRLVAIVFDGLLSRGRHRIAWMAPANGRGIYGARLRLGSDDANELFVTWR